MSEVARNICDRAAESPFTTRIHGDAKLPNIMFAGDAVKFIDFGNVSLGHPGFDVMYFLYLSTDREFRRRHLDAIVNEYCRQLGKWVPLSTDKLRAEMEGQRKNVMVFSSAVSQRGSYNFKT